MEAAQSVNHPWAFSPRIYTAPYPLTSSASSASRLRQAMQSLSAMLLRGRQGLLLLFFPQSVFSPMELVTISNDQLERTQDPVFR